MLIDLLEHVQEEESSVMLDAITTGIGLAPFFDRLEGLSTCEQFQSALHGPKHAKGQTRNGQSLQQAGKEGGSRFFYAALLRSLS